MMEPQMEIERKKDRAPRTERQKRYITWGWAMPAILGAVFGAVIAFGSDGAWKDIINGTAQLDLAIGLVAAALAGPAFLTIIYKWHKSLDEQEERAVLWGNSLGLYFGMSLWAVWTLLAATNLVPPVDVFIVIALSGGVFAAYWAWQKYSL
jgi:hypothetical protein